MDTGKLRNFFRCESQYFLCTELVFLFQVYPDRACKRTVLSLTVKCYNSGNECDWIGELINLPVSIQKIYTSPVNLKACS